MVNDKLIVPSFSASATPVIGQHNRKTNLQGRDPDNCPATTKLIMERDWIT